jgi:hypothetical protein
MPACGWLQRLVRWFGVMPTAESSNTALSIVETPVQIFANDLHCSGIKKLLWMRENLAPSDASPIIVATTEHKSVCRLRDVFAAQPIKEPLTMRVVFERGINPLALRHCAGVPLNIETLESDDMLDVSQPQIWMTQCGVHHLTIQK